MDRASLVSDTITTWATERNDLSFESMRTVLALGTLVKTIIEKSERALAPLQLTAGEFDVLATLRRHGPNASLNPSDIAEFTMISPSGLTNRLCQLEKAGLISRSIEPSDRRRFKLSLTPEGCKKIDRAIEIIADLDNDVMSPLSKAAQKNLTALVTELL